MAPFSMHVRLAFLLLVGVVSRSAAAGSPDPSTLRDQLEDQVLDGDQDAEDLAVLRGATHGLGLGRASGTAYISVVAFGGTRLDGQREMGGLVVLGLPLGRFGRRSLRADVRLPPVPDQGEVEQVPTLWQPTALLEGPVGPAGRPAAESIVMTPDLARSCVRAAWRTLGIADDASIDSMAARARSSAALPELRLRAMRTADTSGRVTLTDADPNRYTEAGTATNWLEARLTFRLDRLLFADDEVSIERVRVDRSELRARTAGKVLQALFEWQRAYALVRDASSSSADHFAAILRELEASATLDVMTDGWFGRFRATLGPRAP